MKVKPINSPEGIRQRDRIRNKLFKKAELEDGEGNKARKFIIALEVIHDLESEYNIISSILLLVLLLSFCYLYFFI